MFCVIIGDIIQSRILDNSERREVTARLNEILGQINKKYQANIMASFVRGDFISTGHTGHSARYN